jgi:HAMP domain-containing protein
MLANLRIRWKLVAIFLLPALTLSTVAVTRIVSTLSDGFQADRELRSLQFSTRVAALAGELQGERTLSTQWAGTGKAQGGEELTTQRARVDRALADLRANAEELGPELGGARVTKAWQTAQERLEALVTHRRSLDRFPSTPAEAQTVFTAAVTDLLNLNAAIAAEASDPDVLRTASSYVAVTSMKEFAGQQRDLGLEAILARTFAQGGRERLTSAIAAEIAWVKRFQATASDAQWTQLATRISSPDVAEAGRLRSALLSEARQGRITADGRTWLTATAARQDALRQEESALAADVLAANRAVAVRMKQRLINDILITLFVLALALGFAMNMARSMVRPLARLRDTANDVAERRLPEIVERLARSERIDPKAEAVSVGTEARDEIGDVARAFKSTHEVAVQVATEQAALRKSIGDMFLNLARRSQSLIDRQIELIDELERNETDADALQELFQLDHLATRLRRNAEDLIVLSGAKPTRRWTRPVPLYDVIRAATAEVEDYTRIELLPIEDLGVSGQAVADVIHLLAELVENATSFSPPGTKVHIAGQPIEDSAGGYLLEIEDRGVGMSDEDLIEINRRLADPPVIDLTLSRRLGLFVVSRLASRYGIRVQLRHSWYGGVTALVELPAALLVQPDEVATPAGNVPAANGARVAAERPQLGARDVAKPYVPLRRHATQPGHGAAFAPGRRHASPPPERPGADRPGPARVPAEMPSPPRPAEPVAEGPESGPRVPGDLPGSRSGAPLAATDAAPRLPGDLPRRPSGPLPRRDPGAGRNPADEAPGAPARPTGPQRRPEPASAAAVNGTTARAESTPADTPAPVTKVGLPRRVPRANLAPAWVAGPGAPAPPGAGGRSPDEVRSMLASYRTGLERGRSQSAADGPPGSEPDTGAGGQFPPEPDARHERG